ncbi:MAG: PD40 domain-containing protein [Lentisphaeria bacterium]|nr:PD40 domain-containing protein [Lentisphaeria bacterium]
MKRIVCLLFLLGSFLTGAENTPVGKDPVFTQDGKSILYQITDKEGTPCLWQWDLQSGRQTPLNLEGQAPFRLKNGRMFYRTAGLFAELCELDLTKKSGKTVELPQPMAGTPMEKPNGEVVYPAGFDDPPELFRWNPATGKTVPEKSFPRTLQALSADGKWMVLTSKFQGMRNIALIDRKSGRKVFETKQTSERGCYGAVFSPDSRYLVYQTTGIQPISDLALLDLKTLKVTKLTSDNADNHAPAFSPDGKKLVFCFLKGDIYRLKIIYLP